MTGAIVNSTTRSLSWFLLWGISVFVALIVAKALLDGSTSTRLPERRADLEIASAFVRWWLSKALDYSPSTAANNQQSSANWMDKEVASSFSQTFWSDGKGVRSQIVFIPTHYGDPVSIEERTISVSVFGVFVSCDDPLLASHFAKIDFVVRPDADGWRVGGWKLAYDPDCSKTIKFLSRAKTGKANSTVNQRALTYFRSAADLELSHNMLSAAEAYSQSIKLNPQYAWAYLNRGRVRSDLKQYDIAIQDFSKAIELDPTLWPAYFSRGLARTFVTGSTAALADYDEAIRLCPSCSYAFIDRAIERDERGDLHGALADFTAAIKLAPLDSMGYASRANLRIRMSDLCGALSDANEAIQLKPNSATAYRTRGDVWSAMKIQFAAQRDYKRAERLHDLHPSWY